MVGLACRHHFAAAASPRFSARRQLRAQCSELLGLDCVESVQPSPRSHHHAPRSPDAGQTVTVDLRTLRMVVIDRRSSKESIAVARPPDRVAESRTAGPTIFGSGTPGAAGSSSRPGVCRRGRHPGSSASTGPGLVVDPRTSIRTSSKFAEDLRTIADILGIDRWQSSVSPRRPTRGVRRAMPGAWWWPRRRRRTHHRRRPYRRRRDGQLGTHLHHLQVAKVPIGIVATTLIRSFPRSEAPAAPSTVVSPPADRAVARP